MTPPLPAKREGHGSTHLHLGIDPCSVGVNAFWDDPTASRDRRNGRGCRWAMGRVRPT